MTKPFDIGELLARIEVQLRNKKTIFASEVICVGELSLDTATHIVTVQTRQR